MHRCNSRMFQVVKGRGMTKEVGMSGCEVRCGGGQKKVSGTGGICLTPFPVPVRLAARSPSWKR
jgi:hypothetical protein